MQAELPGCSIGIQHLYLDVGHGGVVVMEVVEVVVVVWVGVAWSRASGRCEKNGELRRTIRDVCAWRSCELWTHPCQC